MSVGKSPRSFTLSALIYALCIKLVNENFWVKFGRIAKPHLLLMKHFWAVDLRVSVENRIGTERTAGGSFSLICGIENVVL